MNSTYVNYSSSICPLSPKSTYGYSSNLIIITASTSITINNNDNDLPQVIQVQNLVIDSMSEVTAQSHTVRATGTTLISSPCTRKPKNPPIWVSKI